MVSIPADAWTVLTWAPLLLLVATMPIFAMRARGRPVDPDVRRRGASVVLGYWVRDWMIWVLSPVETLLVRRRVSPDMLNYLGVTLSVGAGAAFVARQLPLAAWLVALGGICDVLDGRVARARRLASAYGEFLDATLDRFAETAVLVGVAWYLSGSPWMVATTAAAIGGSLLVSYTRARGEALGVTGTGGLLQRAERVVVLALTALLDTTVTPALGWAPGSLLALGIAAIATGSISTAVYRTIVIARTLARRRATASGDVSPAPESEARVPH